MVHLIKVHALPDAMQTCHISPKLQSLCSPCQNVDNDNLLWVLYYQNAYGKCINAPC